MTATVLDAHGVSPENKYQIIKYLLSPELHSRTDAAKSVSLSAVTVGKVASAMQQRGILCSEQREGGRGRSTELVFASRELSAICIELGQGFFRCTRQKIDKTSAILCESRVNDSLSYEDALLRFLDTASTELGAIPQKDIMGISLLYDKEYLGARGTDVKAIDGLSPDAVLSSSGAIGLYFANRYPDKVCLRVLVSDKIYTSLYANGINLSERGMGYVAEGSDELGIISELCKHLKTLFETVVPHSVIVESDRITADKKLNRHIFSTVKNITNLSEEHMPIFEDVKDLSFCESAALELIVDIYSRQLAGL